MNNLLRLRGARSLSALAIAAGSISGFAAPASSAPSARTALSQCNGTDNVGGQALECRYTVTNEVDGSASSSTVTLVECHGAANAPATMVCTSSTTTSSSAVTSVDQCNGSGNGGGGTVTCSVDVTNNIRGNVTPTRATVNQCNASGMGGGTAPTVHCSPFPADTTNATVDQCNDSGNGGGGTRRVRCTVSSDSTTTSVIDVSVNQCNGSGNGGGATVTCRTNLTNNVIEPSPKPTASATPTPAPTDTPGGDPTPTPQPSPSESSPPGNEEGGNENEKGGNENEEGGTSVLGRHVVAGGGSATGQVTHLPSGGAAVGGGSTSGIENTGLLLVGSVFLIAAGSGLRIRRRTKDHS